MRDAEMNECVGFARVRAHDGLMREGRLQQL
jgi:hypothetical protein